MEIDVGSLEDISESNIDPSLGGANVSQLGLEEIFHGLVVPETALEEETLGDATKPILVKLSISRIFPEGLHASGSIRLGSGGEAGENGSIDGTSGNTTDGLVTHF